MGSFRRSTSLHRDGSGQNGNASPSAPPSPKSSHAKSIDLLMVLERAWAGFPGFLLQRSSRPGERLKTKGLLHLRKAFFHFAVCFMIGILVGFTPFMAVDISKKLATKHEAFSFEGDLVDSNINKQPFMDNVSAAAVVGGDRRDVLETLNTQSPFRESELVPRKLLIIVTPTYARPFQAYYLNRLAQTLRVAPPPLLWIVVEMAVQSGETARILRETGVMYRHLVCDHNATAVKDEGVQQRNIALAHIEKYRLDGIVFFADDDSVYSADLFAHMRKIRRFGAWPVAMLAEGKKKVVMEGPVCNGTRVTGWHTSQRSKMSKRFHVNMSGFAFNSTILWDPKSWGRPTLEPIRQLDKVQDGLQETKFVEQLVEDESQMEGLPGDCSLIMVWHLRVEAPELVYPNDWLMQKNLEIVAPLT